MAINKYYITPEMYEVVRQEIVAFLDDYAESHPTFEYEPILAIATTRGLPAVISRSFDAAANHNSACIRASFESQLAKLGFPMDTSLVNPYKNRIGRSFKWLFTPCGGQGYLRGKIFVVSRLDSDDANGDDDYVDDVIKLVERSQNLAVNKFGVTLVFDSNQSGLGSIFDDLETPVARYMRDHRWCVYYNDDAKFLHGKSNPPNAGCGEVEPGVEGFYNSWPELVHVTLGRNHRECSPDPICSEAVCYDYARWYEPHPAGLFESLESWNGVALRIPEWPSPPGGDPSSGWQQGSILQWIGAGGSFALGRVNGTSASLTQFAIPNLYESGLSWGEAIWTAIQFQNAGNEDNFFTPLGDPLARVIIYDPDADGSGVIDSVDVALVLAGRYDVNKDGIVDEADLELVLDVYGRSCWDFPNIPGGGDLLASDLPASPCGDLNHDGAVNQGDLSLVDDYINGTDCPGLDINQNGFVDLHDRAVVLEHIELSQHGSWCIGDVDFDGDIDVDDVNAIFLYLQTHNWLVLPEDPGWNPIYDIDCNGQIGRVDWIKLTLLNGHPCPPQN